MFQAFLIILVLFLAVIDQLIKIIMELWLKPIGAFEVIRGFIGFSYVQNRGAAFGMFQNGAVVLAVFTAVIIALGFFLLTSKKIIKSKIELFAVSLILSGGIGNLIDRVCRGYVVDFLEFKFFDFPVFNFADCLITVGTSIFIVHLIYSLCKEYKKEKAEKALQLNGEEQIKDD